jgi:hypothetical protein
MEANRVYMAGRRLRRFRRVRVDLDALCPDCRREAIEAVTKATPV